MSHEYSGHPLDAEVYWDVPRGFQDVTEISREEYDYIFDEEDE